MAIRSRPFLAGGVLVVLLLCLALSWATRDVMNRLPSLANGSSSRRRTTLVDLRPWQTAQQLAALAVTAEELEYARDAERLAGHEVDQAFAGALREAGMEQHSLSGEALTLSKKVEQLEQTIKDDQARVDALRRSTENAPQSTSSTSTGGDSAASDLDVAKAQLQLDADELADEQQDLARAAGDKRVEIQQELAAHEAAMHKNEARSSGNGQVATVSERSHGTLASLIGAYFDQNTRVSLIKEAMQAAQSDAAAQTAKHNAIQADAERASSGPGMTASRSDQLTKLKVRSAQRQLLAIYDDRIQTERELAAVYGKWADQVALQHRIVIHLILQSVALIAFIVLCVMVLDELVRRLISHPGIDRRRKQTLDLILKLTVQFTGALLVLLVIFGAPNQTPTILGLTTAGLTVVLQDFIIAFFGWFILMGKNGIRVGDWVEINGVGGEVVEVGLFRTALLETGNWTDKGHPTGRRVTFINSFAIKGQFFNFSTTGQWMWDEITVSIPPDANSYETIESIREAVFNETQTDASTAEQEWRRATGMSSAGVSRFSAGPAVDMRPGLSGIDLIVRYVTRASHRFDLKNRLYQRVIDLLHKPGAPRAQPDDTPSG